VVHPHGAPNIISNIPSEKAHFLFPVRKNYNDKLLEHKQTLIRKNFIGFNPNEIQQKP
jgi:hypothetical protein